MGNRIWTKEEIVNLLQTNDQMVWRSLKQLYLKQTASERASGTTHVVNGVGFNSRDAEILSSIARSYEQWHRLTPKQTALVRRKIMKYAGQLTKIANGEI